MPLFVLFLSVSLLLLFYFFIGFGFVEHVTNHFFLKKVLNSVFFFFCGETGFENVALDEVVRAFYFLPVLRACMILVGALVEFVCKAI